MKKTLAIVLALVMVLAMIPAMGAATETKIESNSYDLTVQAITKAGALDKVLGSATDANSVTAEYKYTSVEDTDLTDKWSENAKMAAITIADWDEAFSHFVVEQDSKDDAAAVKAFEKALKNSKITVSVTVDGDKVDVGTAKYADELGVKYVWTRSGNATKGYTYTFSPVVVIPVEITEAGYQDSMKIALVETDKDGNTVKETAVITLTMKNTDVYKDLKTATITDIAFDAASGKAPLSAYIVGSKIYLDYVDEKTDSQIKITFADENGKPFTAIAYAYAPEADPQWDTKYEVADAEGAITVVEYGKVDDAYALASSVAKFAVSGQNATKVRFVLETKAAGYVTKDYDIVAREYIQEEDPKGIYFAETTKTIAMGETYTPVVMGVKTGKPVGAVLYIETEKTDAEVIDLVNNNKSVIGTREGVAYVTAYYQTNAAPKHEYIAASMKIIVTLPGESIPELDPAAEIYYVTCRALNVRAGAGTSYKKVDLIHRGDAVKVVELKNGWAKLDDGTYVCAKYISK